MAGESLGRRDDFGAMRQKHLAHKQGALLDEARIECVKWNVNFCSPDWPEETSRTVRGRGLFDRCSHACIWLTMTISGGCAFRSVSGQRGGRMRARLPAVSAPGGNLLGWQVQVARRNAFETGCLVWVEYEKQRSRLAMWRVTG